MSLRFAVYLYLVIKNLLTKDNPVPNLVTNTQWFKTRLGYQSVYFQFGVTEKKSFSVLHCTSSLWCFSTSEALEENLWRLCYHLFILLVMLITDMPVGFGCLINMKNEIYFLQKSLYNVAPTSYFATPKSAILIRLSDVSKMFLVFKSRWVISLEWRY